MSAIRGQPASAIAASSSRRSVSITCWTPSAPPTASPHRHGLLVLSATGDPVVHRGREDRRGRPLEVPQADRAAHRLPPGAVGAVGPV